jgi:hypothetical protein
MSSNLDRSFKKYKSDDDTNLKCSGDIMLEPRLQEYMKKRKYYKENGIQPSVPLEREFSISNNDKRLLRAFLSGDTNVYKQKRYEKIMEEKKREASFPSSNFPEDPRVLVPIKQENKVPTNRGMFVPEKNNRYYEDPIKVQDEKIMDSRDFCDKNFRGFDVNDSKFNPRPDPKINPGYEDINKCGSPYRISDGSVYDSCKASQKRKHKMSTKNTYNDYHNDPHQTYLNYDLIDEYEHNMNRIKKEKPIIKEHPDSKLLYQSRMNTEVESELIRGMPSMRPHNRSYGYRDTFENHFDYIDDDFQNPDNTDLWVRGGEATRLDNKFATKNRTYVREIM